MSGEDDDDAYHDARGIDKEDGAQFLGTQQYDNEFVNDADLLDDLMNPGGGAMMMILFRPFETFGTVR